jgi:hypothetical protein
MDPQQAVVPNVEVVATNEATGVTIRGHSNEAGIYILPFLSPGRYTINTAAQGFKKYERRGVVIETGQEMALDLVLELGSLTEVVDVTAQAPLLETTSSMAAQMINSRDVSEMPLGGRRSLQLARLSPATVFVPGAGGDKPVFAIAGGRAWNQMIWLDGGNMQNMRLGVGQVDTDPPVEFVREVRILQNNYNAEYGGSAGGVVVSTTKSGTNEFHGSLYYFFRNDALDAANFFAVTQGTSKIKAPLRYNQFGATLGGPIVRNKTHFYGGYEGRRRSTGVPVVLTVPTELQRQGNFSQTLDSRGVLIPIYDPATTRVSGNATVREPFPGNQIPQNRLDRVATQLIRFWPLPNRPPANLAGGQNFSGNGATIAPNNVVFAKLDHAFSEKNHMYARYLRHTQPSWIRTVYTSQEAETTQFVDGGETTYLFSDVHTFSSNLIMDARYYFGDRKGYLYAGGTGSKLAEEVGIPGVPSGAFPEMNVAGIARLGNGSERAQFPIRQHQVINTWTYVRSNHVMKFGGEVRKSLNFESQSTGLSGIYGFQTTGTGLPGNSQTGVGFASYMLGFTDSFSSRVTDQLDRYSWYLASFFQDDWKVSRSLILNLGVRWETDTPMIDTNDRMNSFDPKAMNPVSATPGVVRFAGVNGWPSRQWSTDWNNFGPRFGFAWRPRDSQTWVIRGGYGIFFEHPFATGVPNQASLGFERSANLNSPDNGLSPAMYLAQGPGVNLQPPARDDSFGAVRVGERVQTNVSFFDLDRKIGYAHQYNFGIQRQMPGNIVFEVSYLANLARGVPVGALNINQVPPEGMGPGNAQIRRPFPQFNNIMRVAPAIGFSTYHAGLVRLEKRFSAGLSFLTSYTWSRNIGDVDMSSSDLIGDNQIYQDLYRRHLDKGPTALDIVQRFTLSSVYDLPFGKGRRWLDNGLASSILGGWTIGSIATLQSGGPATVITPTNTTNAFGAGAQRAHVVRDPNLPGEQRTVNRWFDTGAFSAPPQFTFGNAGRGIVRADGRVSIDISINKNLYFREDRFLQIRAELFNAPNHPDFLLPNRSLGAPNFATVSSASDARSIQLGLRLVF